MAGAKQRYKKYTQMKRHTFSYKEISQKHKIRSHNRNKIPIRLKKEVNIMRKNPPKNTNESTLC